MQEGVLLIDFENIQKVNLASLNPCFRVVIFVGCNQKSLPFSLVQDTQKLGSRVEWVKVNGIGGNALDFHIAYYLGYQVFQHRGTSYYILSHDTGFDPLVQHINGSGGICKRITSLSALTLVKSTATKKAVDTEVKIEKPEKKAVVSVDQRYLRTVEILKKSPAKSRPSRHDALCSHISSLFQRKLSNEEVEAIVKHLYTKGKVSETDGKLSYNL
jgi:hypothetical protein